LSRAFRERRAELGSIACFAAFGASGDIGSVIRHNWQPNTASSHLCIWGMLEFKPCLKQALGPVCQRRIANICSSACWQIFAANRTGMPDLDSVPGRKNTPTG